MSWTKQLDEPERSTTNDGINPRAKAFGPALKEFRERDSRRLSQSRLAELTWCDHSYISRLESGARTPSWDAVERIAEALELNADDRNRLLASAGFLPDDLNGLIDPQAVEIQRVLVAVKGTDKEAGVRAVLQLIVSQAAA